MHNQQIITKKLLMAMKRMITSFVLVLTVLTVAGQGVQPSAGDNAVLNELRNDLRKSYGNDYPYSYAPVKLTKSPRGYKPFYISHYARHGSRYYWSERLYKELDTLLTVASQRHQLTAEGEAFCKRFMEARKELMTGATELTQLGWEQHQYIARTMYNNFPQVFKRGGNVLAISSLVGRCVISMSAFCQELVQCNPKIEIREQSSCFTLDGVVPSDGRNPVKHHFKKVRPRYEKSPRKIASDPMFHQRIVSRVFTSTDGLPGSVHHIGSNLVNLYTSLPSIGHEGMMGNIVTDEEMAGQWEVSNLGSYSWVFEPQYETIPILEDIIAKADAVISGTSDRIADLRFGHDTYIGPLTVLMGINGADRDPVDPAKVKNCYQNWQTCKASNIQIVFYRGKHADDILVKCLLNGREARLPMATNQFPYYRWADFRQFYTERCDKHKEGYLSFWGF